MPAMTANIHGLSQSLEAAADRLMVHRRGDLLVVRAGFEQRPNPRVAALGPSLEYPSKLLPASKPSGISGSL
jgi:hypothetical protein